jgi:hypothetical protein
MSSAAIALAMGIAAPALAQDQTDSAASPPVIAPPPPRTDDAVGPAQLRDFSLSGTVTRPADPQPSASPQTEPQQTATTAPPPARSASSGRSAVQPARNAAPEQSQQAAGAPTTASTGSDAFAFLTPTPASNQPASFAPPLPSPVTSPIADPIANPESGLISKWPWLLALLTAAGAALWYFRRHRPSGYAFAGAGADGSAFDLSPPPAPPRAIPRADPVPPPASRPPVPEGAPKPATAPVGIVSTRLRPWLEVEFMPAAAIVDDEKGAIQFEVTIYNSGSAPARDVLVEAAMFNAGPDQDQVIGQFFARPSEQGEGVTIPPLQRMNFRSLVSLPRDQLRIFEVEKRSLFVPLVGFNAVYRWSNGQGQTSASFLVGRNTNGEKMGPFRVDQGPKTFRGLAAHEHTLRLRK